MPNEIPISVPTQSLSEKVSDDLLFSDSGGGLLDAGNQQQVDPSAPIVAPQETVEGLGEHMKFHKTDDAVLGLTETPDGLESQNVPDRGQPQTAEAVLRSVQSEKDKAVDMINQMTAERAELLKYKGFVESFDKDEKFRMAVMADYNPDLFKPGDPRAYVDKKLSEEFGAEFDYDNAGVNDRILYAERLKVYDAEARQGSQDIPSIKELRAARAAERAQTETLFNTQKTEIMQANNWKEEDFNQYVGWANKLDLKALVPIFNASMKGIKTLPTKSPISVPGVPNAGDPNADLEVLFGRPQGSFIPNK